MIALYVSQRLLTIATFIYAHFDANFSKQLFMKE